MHCGGRADLSHRQLSRNVFQRRPAARDDGGQQAARHVAVCASLDVRATAGRNVRRNSSSAGVGSRRRHCAARVLQGSDAIVAHWSASVACRAARAARAMLGAGAGVNVDNARLWRRCADWRVSERRRDVYCILLYLCCFNYSVFVLFCFVLFVCFF